MSNTPAASQPVSRCRLARPQPVTFNGRSLRAVPEAVASAREFVPPALGILAQIDPGHADDVTIVVSELVTNAIEHAIGITNTWLELEVWPLWTLVIVDDRDPVVHPPAVAAAADSLELSGRGLFIVEALSERFWWQHRRISKTAHAAILRTGVKLTEADRAVLNGLEGPSTDWLVSEL